MSKIETYKQKTGPKPILIIGIVFSFLIVLTSITLLIYPFPSNTFEKYFKIEHPIVFKGEVYPQSALQKDHEIYVPFSFIQEKIDPTITLDKASNSVIITTKNKVLQLPTESLTYFVNEKPFSLETPAITDEKRIKYLQLEPFLTTFNIKMDYKTETGAVLIKKGGDTLLTGIVQENGDEDVNRLRMNPTLTANYVAEVKANEKVEVEKDQDQFFFIRKENGIGGYIKKEMIQLKEPKMIANVSEEKLVKPLTTEWPINLTWEAVYTKTPNPNQLPKTPGVNIVAPTWFKLKNQTGDVTNLGSLSYSKWAHENGFKLWGLFSNDFDPVKTHVAFKDFETRQKIIRQLLQYGEMYKLDGINLDIENVNPEDGPFITQFVREATPYFHQAGLVVSMDITFLSSSGNWSKFYEREKLKDIVDYLIVMAYDEHWANSPVAGSVASLPWVETNLKELLTIVPHDRLILGIPLYARIWKEKETVGGNLEVSSKAYTMAQIEEWLKEKGVKPRIDNESGQYYGEYYDEKEKATYKVWIENEYSLHKRAQLVHKYSLAGIGSWSRYFGNDRAWTALAQSLKKIDAVNVDSPKE